jgi:uncharacterized protein
MRMTAREALAERRDEIIRLAESHGARNVRVFGSVARGEETDASDVDFLVDMEPKRSIYDLVGLRLDLIDLLGRRVDVFTPGTIYWLLRRKILQEARPL